MAFEGFDTLHDAPVNDRLGSINRTKEAIQQMALVKGLFSQIQQASDAITEEISEGVEVTNLDEISTALHNELNNATKLLISALLLLKSSQKQGLADIKDASLENAKFITKAFKDIKPLDSITIKNLADIEIPDELKVTNLNDLAPFFKSLENAVKGLVFELPTPQITVNPAEVRVDVPEAQINVPEADFGPILDALRKGLKKLKDNNLSNPVFVRMTDLDSLLAKLDEIKQASQNVMLGFPGLIGVRGASGGMIDPATAAGQSLGMLVPKTYDYISLSPASLPTTVTYKTGGASGTTVATLTIAYSGTDISSVTRT